MKKIPFKHPECNGWAIYDSKYINAGCPENIHVAEGKYKIDAKGDKQFDPNSAMETICEEKLKKNPKHMFCSDDPSKIRLALAKFQNEEKEVCGVCVSHFYADKKPLKQA